MLPIGASLGCLSSTTWFGVSKRDLCWRPNVFLNYELASFIGAIMFNFGQKNRYLSAWCKRGVEEEWQAIQFMSKQIEVLIHLFVMWWPFSLMARDIGTGNRQIEQQIEKNISGRSNRKKILIQIIFLLSLLLPNSSNSVSLFYFFVQPFRTIFYLRGFCEVVSSFKQAKQTKQKSQNVSIFISCIECFHFLPKVFWGKSWKKCFAFWMIMSCLKL